MTVQLALLPPAAAVIFAVPSPTEVTVPFETLTTPESEVVHFTALSVAFSGATVALRVKASFNPSSRLFLLRVTL